MQQALPATPWYKQFWPWFLIGLVLFAIAFCSVLLYFAVTTRDTLVSDNYYKEGLAINQELNRDRKAKVLGLKGEFHFYDNGRIIVTLDHTKPLGDLPYLVLKFIHPTLAHRDQKLLMTPLATDRFEVKLNKALTGHWYLDLRDPSDTWRLKAEIGLPNSSVITLLPAKN